MRTSKKNTRLSGKILPVSLLRFSRDRMSLRESGIKTASLQYDNGTKTVLKKYLFGVVMAAAILSSPFCAAALECFVWPLRETRGSFAYDGDTINIHMPGLPDTISKMSVRVAGIDTPEIRGQCDQEKAAAIRARDRVRQLLDNAVRSNIPIQFCDPHWGRYGGRVVALVAIGDIWLHELLIAEHLGRPYDGDGRTGWCLGQ